MFFRPDRAISIPKTLLSEQSALANCGNYWNQRRETLISALVNTDEVFVVILKYFLLLLYKFHEVTHFVFLFMMACDN